MSQRLSDLQEAQRLDREDATVAARARWKKPLPDAPKPMKPVGEMTDAELAGFERALLAHHEAMPRWRAEQTAMLAALKP